MICHMQPILTSGEPDIFRRVSISTQWNLPVTSNSQQWTGAEHKEPSLTGMECVVS